MTPLSFVYWLQGFLELSSPNSISQEQVKIIEEHIALVLKKETVLTITKVEGDTTSFCYGEKAAEDIFVNTPHPFANLMHFGSC